MKVLKLPLLLALMLFSSFGLAAGLPVSTPEEQGMSSARFRLLTNLLRQYVEEGKIAGLVAGVARNGHVVYLEHMGWQEIAPDERVPMQTDSIFQIRSMSKPIVSLAAMQLIEKGLLRLDDAVSEYIPSFADMELFENPEDFANSGTKPPSRLITIEDLLLHTGGLSHRDDPLYRNHQVRSRSDTLEQLVEKVAAVPLMADPGSRWIYSISTTVLGRVVEIVSEQKLDDYLEQNILNPLQMPDTGFYVPPEGMGRLARIYQIPREGRPLEQVPEMDVPITENPPLLEGSAGMVSTVPDYLRFLQAFLNDGELDGSRVLSPSGVALMTQNQLPDVVMPIGFSSRSPMRDTGWGYGFSVIIDSRYSAFSVNDGEFGWNGSLGTFSWADPETGTVAILMMQVVPSGAYGLSGLFKSLVAQTILE